jgi:hypothetical protein
LKQNQNTNQWANELNALIASPQHHKLLFENELVRVLDTNISPGETTNVHTHQFPSSLYFLCWSHLVVTMKKEMYWLIQEHSLQFQLPVWLYGADR